MTDNTKRLLTSPNVLTTDEEISVFKEYAKNPKDMELRNLVVEKNMGLVYKVSSRYVNMGIDTEELQQEGVFGLITAVERFDYKKGNKFSTYAIHWINQSMTRFLLNHRRNIRVPVHVSETMLKIKRVKKEYLNQYGEEAPIEYIATILQIPEPKIESVMQVFRNIESVSLNSIVSNDNNKDDSELIDYMKDTNAESLEDVVIASETNRRLLKIMEEILTEKECNIVKLRFGIEDEHPRTLQEVGTIYGLTRERIRQIDKNAIRKLRCSKRIKNLL